MELDQQGWLQGATHIPSPNCDTRPDGMPVELVVVHAISLPPEQFGGNGIVELFTNTLNPAEHPFYAEIAHLRVSAHFLVRRDGAVYQFVSTLQRAWHAGVSSWQGRERCNDFSIGIELEGSDHQPFEPVQYEILNQIIAACRARFPILEVTGHQHIAPQRKTDPGPFFCWEHLAFTKADKL